MPNSRCGDIFDRRCGSDWGWECNARWWRWEIWDRRLWYSDGGYKGLNCKSFTLWRKLMVKGISVQTDNGHFREINEDFTQLERAERNVTKPQTYIEDYSLWKTRSREQHNTRTVRRGRQSLCNCARIVWSIFNWKKHWWNNLMVYSPSTHLIIRPPHSIQFHSIPHFPHLISTFPSPPI